MKKKIIIYVISGILLIAAVLAMILGTKQEKELSSGAKFVFLQKRGIFFTESANDTGIQKQFCRGNQNGY